MRFTIIVAVVLVLSGCIETSETCALRSTLAYLSPDYHYHSEEQRVMYSSVTYLLCRKIVQDRKKNNGVYVE